jgi:choline dehydrogenase-like flavoprotein
VDAHVRDAWGLPVARLSGTTHPETVRTANFLRLRAEEWLRVAGCEKVWSHVPTLYLSGGQHQAGTCRMSDDPKLGVCDRFGRVHGQTACGYSTVRCTRPTAASTRSSRSLPWL